MEIRVYDIDFKRLNQIDNFNYLIWTRKYNEVGEFELLLPLTTKNRKLFIPGNVISKAGALEAGVIEDIEIKEGDENTILIKGRFLESYLQRYLIKEKMNFNGRVEEAVKKIIASHFPVPGVIVTTDNSFPEKVSFQVTLKNVYTIISKLSKGSQIGFRMRPDFKAKKIYFEMYKGIDRSTNKKSVQFSEKYGNVNNVEYKYNDQKFANVAIVGGEGEGPDRKYVTVGANELTGLDKREIFVDAKDIRMGEGMTPEEYTELLRERGRQKLSESVVAESIEVQTLEEGNFIYKKDYDLGDIVSVKKESWNINMKQRITAIDEIYEDGALTIVPTIGSPLPETIEWGED